MSDEIWYYTYTHVRPDTGAVFYVGKGQKDRARDKNNRNSHWRSIVKKNDGKFNVRIINWFKTEADALASEIWQIAELKSSANLSNKTPGGDGFGIWDAERKLKQSLCVSKRFEETAARKLHGRIIAAAMAAPSVKENQSKAQIERHTKYPEHRQNLSLKFSGNNNPSKKKEVKLRKAQTRTIKGKDFYLLSPETYAAIGEKNRTHMKAKGDNIHTKNPTVRAKNSQSRTQQWATAEFRMKMLPHNWHVNYVRKYSYWGA